MADNVAITAGSGTTVATDDVSTVHFQKVKLVDGTADSSTAIPGTADGLYTQGSIAHGAADAGAPVKVGGKAANALPTAEANDDRVNFITDLWGRPLVSHIDPAMMTWKSYNTTTSATGAVIWDPSAGKKIAITYLSIGAYGTTAARLILWFGANADSTYSAGTDQLVFAASFAPSSTSKPGACPPLPHPIFCTTADHELHITTDANLSVDVTVYGYEW